MKLSLYCGRSSLDSQSVWEHMTAVILIFRSLHPLDLGLLVETFLLPLPPTTSHIPTHIPALKKPALTPRYLSIFLTTREEGVKGVWEKWSVLLQDHLCCLLIPQALSRNPGRLEALTQLNHPTV